MGEEARVLALGLGFRVTHCASRFRDGRRAGREFLWGLKVGPTSVKAL